MSAQGLLILPKIGKKGNAVSPEIREEEKRVLKISPIGRTARDMWDAFKEGPVCRNYLIILFSK